MLALLVLALTLITVLGTRELSQREEDRMVPGGPGTVEAPERLRSLSEAGDARFLSVITYRPDGQTGASYMVGAGTPEFERLARVCASAKPVAGVSDESFENLIIFAFGQGDTLDLPYSAEHNLIMLNDQAYQPAADLAPLIVDLELKFS